ncbi:hypothetical protein [Pseudomonas nunensis]|uniref:Uncharacterized protein n=1 Tax=Pseudomonas nunensis TaxID=2961896 RepID=A0ABY5ERY7_9PSED|nr:hypothetical protein [Pseudomonas nunensis]KPN90951.1 hypothetical protein AL066_11640 [Pseudomonas nunensis]MCL5228311.1 hypothetical protein [Pseudomonas nunensis]UTO17218.1 hypothetical protein NK667_12975 [Pseudomonas nunensis]
MITRNKPKAVGSVAAQTHNLRMSEDAFEKQLLLAELQELVEKHGGVDTRLVDLDNMPFQLRVGSSLYQAHTPAKVLLEEMLKFKSMIGVHARYRTKETDEFCITGRGEVIVFAGQDKHDITQRLDADPNAIERIRLLAGFAKVTGEFVWDSDEVVLSQWLRFHDLYVPATIAGVKNLIAFLTLELPDVEPLGNYWGQLVAEDDSSAVLTDEEIQRVRALTAKTLSQKGRLLEKLYSESVKALPDPYDPQAASRLIKEMFLHSTSQALAKKYISELQWYGAGPDENVTAEDLAQILVTAVLLDLDHHSGRDSRRNHICGYDLYQPANADLPYFLILDDLERYLLSNQIVSMRLSRLAIHLLLAKAAPEFLVRDIPDQLLVGSVGWVSFCSAVATLELKSPGSSQSMTYDQVMAFAGIEPVGPWIEKLQGLAAIPSIIDWGLINKLITHEQLAESEKDTSIVAVTAYDGYATSIAQAAETFSTVMPSRKQVALKALEDAAPGFNLEERSLFTRKDRDYKQGTNTRNWSSRPDEQPNSIYRPTGHPLSMVDAHISGYLVGGNWDKLNGESIFKTWPGLSGLDNVDVEFDRVLKAHYSKMNSAHVTIMKLAMSSMMDADRVVFQNSKIGFFTLRPSVAKNHIPEVTSGLVGSSTPGRNYLAETQAEKDAATGRYGVVMCAFHGNDQITCYEVFILLGKCQKNPELGALIGRTQKMRTAARVDFSGDMSEKTRAIPTTADIPVDIRNYTHGVHSNIKVYSAAVIEKLGEIAGPNIRVSRGHSIYKNYASEQFDKIATFIVKNRPLVTYEELKEIATELTWMEEKILTQKAQTEFLVNLIVPFKSCIEDLSSGDKNRVADGAFGCIMDTLALFGTAVGVVSKVMSVAARSVSMTSKVASLAKFAITTTISMFNPLDGAGTVGRSAGKLFHKGSLKLGAGVLQTFETATFQLRKIAGSAQSYDLIKAADYSHIGQGLWRPLENGGDAVSICAIARKERWFAMNRLGKPWGPKLKRFDFTQSLSVPRFHKLLPADYTHLILRKSLPIARSKIANALVTLGEHSNSLDTNLVIGLLFGSTAKGRDQALNFLKVVKTDFDGLSGRNFVLAAVKDDITTASLMPVEYKAWKKDGAVAGVDQPVITVYSDNLNDHFYREKLNYEVIAIDLVHEMFRGGPDAKGLSYALDPQTKSQDTYQLNVAPLLNLALGELAISLESPVQKHDSARSLENADTFSLAVVLFDQLMTDKSRFLQNTRIMSAAVGKRRSGPIEGEVLISL